MYALDSNMLIYHFKGVEQVTKRINALPFKEIAVPTVVLFELSVVMYKGQSRTKRAKALEIFTRDAVILPFDQQAADCAAKIRAQLEQEGSPIGPMDTLIAGTVLAAQATLVTHNTREFSRVDGLLLEDWFS